MQKMIMISIIKRHMPVHLSYLFDNWLNGSSLWCFGCSRVKLPLGTHLGSAILTIIIGRKNAKLTQEHRLRGNFTLHHSVCSMAFPIGNLPPHLCLYWLIPQEMKVLRMRWVRRPSLAPNWMISWAEARYNSERSRTMSLSPSWDTSSLASSTRWGITENCIIKNGWKSLFSFPALRSFLCYYTAHYYTSLCMSMTLKPNAVKGRKIMCVGFALLG